MARYRRGDQREERVAEELESDGRIYRVDLIAKRATGVEGWRMTLAFFEIDGPESAFVNLEPAESREEVTGRVERLRGNPRRLLRLLRGEERTED